MLGKVSSWIMDVREGVAHVDKGVLAGQGLCLLNTVLRRAQQVA